jgi:DNA repair protein RadD
VIVFCSGVDHAEQVASEIERVSGQRVGVVVGSTPPLERAAILSDFVAQRIKYLCNVDVLTTGFDAPCIDAIAILRATMSPGLFAQICGRGLRTHSSKKDCLILDFGENIARHGPIDAIDYGKEKKPADGAGEAPEKTCPACNESVFAGARECPCGWIFPPLELKHDERADTTSAVLAAPVRFNVVAVSVSKHQKKGAPDAPPTLRVDYDCQPHGVSGNLTEQISEWVCLAHQGFARGKAVAWWSQHSYADAPSDIDDAVDLIGGGATVMPSTITAMRDGKWWRITGRQFTDEKPESWREPEKQDDAELLDPWARMGEEVPF